MSAAESPDPHELRVAAGRLAAAEAARERMLRCCPKCADTRDMMRYGIPTRRWLGCPTCKRVIPLKGRST